MLSHKSQVVFLTQHMCVNLCCVFKWIPGVDVCLLVWLMLLLSLFRLQALGTTRYCPCLSVVRHEIRPFYGTARDVSKVISKYTELLCKRALYKIKWHIAGALWGEGLNICGGLNFKEKSLFFLKLLSGQVKRINSFLLASTDILCLQ
jgi:hypothetical protein